MPLAGQSHGRCPLPRQARLHGTALPLGGTALRRGARRPGLLCDASARAHWSVSPTGATIGAMAYAFGLPPLFQYGNVVFLVGAAWMPLGLRSADRWVRLGNCRALGGLATVLALETLGGDPEAAYLVAIAAAGYAIGLANSRRNQPKSIPIMRLAAVIPRL